MQTYNALAPLTATLRMQHVFALGYEFETLENVMNLNSWKLLSLCNYLLHCNLICLIGVLNVYRTMG